MVTIDKSCSDTCAQRWSVVDELYWVHLCLQGCVRLDEHDAQMREQMRRELEIVFRWFTWGSIGIGLAILVLAKLAEGS